MLMYTSCGWFFDELSGIETVQVIQYAGRALQLAEQLSGEKLESQFLTRLEQAKSNLTEHSDGRAIYLKFVKPAMVDLSKVAAHYAISSLFESYGDQTRVFSHLVTRENHDLHSEGRRKMALGRIHLQSEITRESETFSYGMLHLGDHNLSGGVRPFRSPEEYDRMKAEMAELFQRQDVPELIRAVDRQFGDCAYSLRFLFRDEQQRIVRILLQSALDDASALHRSFYREYSPLARFLTVMNIPLPDRFRVAIEFALHQDLQAALSQPDLEIAKVQPLLDQIRLSGAAVDEVNLEFAFRAVFEDIARRWRTSPGGPQSVKSMLRALDVLDALPFRVNLWTVQNLAYEVLRSQGVSAESTVIAGRLGVSVS
jgi:uncharacterized protein DUF3536